MRFLKQRKSGEGWATFEVVLGVRELRLLLGLIKKAKIYLPEIKEFMPDKHRLSGMEKRMNKILLDYYASNDAKSEEDNKPTTHNTH